MEISSQVRKLFYTKVDIQQHIEEYQLYGNLKKRRGYSQYEPESLNVYQKHLYLKAVKGFSAFTKEELKIMPAEKKNIVKALYHKTQRVLTLLKHEQVNELTNKFFKTIFPKAKVCKMLLESSKNYTTTNLENKLTFDALGITQNQIIERLIQENILPFDFYKLKPKM